MKQILFFALILLPILGFSQFNVTTTPVPTTCNNNGSVTIEIDNATIGYNYDIEIQLLGSNSPADNKTDAVINTTNTSFNFQFDGLSAGTWSIQVIESNGSAEVNSYSNNFEILDNTPPTPTFTATTSESCGSGVVEIDVTQGSFNSYSLTNLDTGPDYPSQVSTTFSGVEAGSYRVKAVYDCGTETQDITVSNSGSNYSFIRSSQYGSGFDRLSQCGETKHKVVVGLNGAQSIPAERFPVDINYKVYDSNGGMLYNQTKTYTQNWNDEYLYLPHADGNRVVATITDACNISYTQEDIINAEQKVKETVRNGNCGGKYYNFDLNNIALPVTIKFTSYPQGFVPSTIRSEFDDSTYTATITEFDYIDKRISLGDVDHVFPEGNYTIEFSNNCGGITTTWEKQIFPRQKLFINAQVSPACDGENVTTKILLTSSTSAQNKKAGSFQNVEFTSGPATFSISYPVSLNQYLRDGEILIESLPPGTYTVQSSANSCNYTTPTELVIEKEEVLTFDDDITYNCSSFDYNFTVEANHMNRRVYFQRYDGSRWINIINTQYNGSSPKSYAANNLTNTGLYRVAMQYEYYSKDATNRVGTFKCDLHILNEFEYQGSPLDLKDYYVSACGNTGSFDLILDAVGVGILEYKILSKNGDTSFETPYQNSAIFAGLGSGTYKVVIKDACDNTTYANLNVDANKSPRVLANSLCEGQSGGLRTSGLSQFETTWTKDGQPINDSRITFTDNVLTFSPYIEADHVGTYEASITYPNAASCAPITAGITLTTDTDTNPSAGSGQTISLTSNDINGTVNLFDYLTGNYDSFGSWIDASGSNLLKGDEWYAEFASTGTYEFVYRVEGTCNGQDTAKVIINYVTICDKPFNNQPADTFAKIGISNLDQNKVDNWPASMPSGFITLESESKGFVITRINNPENTIAEPREGMIVFDTDEKNGKGCFKLYNGTSWTCIQKACNN